MNAKLPKLLELDSHLSPCFGDAVMMFLSPPAFRVLGWSPQKKIMFIIILESSTSKGH